MKLVDFLDKSIQNLSKAGIGSARLDSLLLIEFVTGFERARILAYPETELSQKQVDQLDGLVKKRLDHTPISYLIQSKEFYGRDFFVDERVLVPRPESESLIELALKKIYDKKLSVLDLGCGSGILGVTLKLERPDWQIVLSDISKEALDVAKINTKKHGLLSRLNFVDTAFLPDKDFDFIIANLPYVPTSFQKNKDLKSEPKIALFAGNDGLDAYRQFFAQLKTKPNKKPQFVMIEALENQHLPIAKLAQKSGYSESAKNGLALLFQQNT